MKTIWPTISIIFWMFIIQKLLFFKACFLFFTIPKKKTVYRIVFVYLHNFICLWFICQFAVSKDSRLQEFDGVNYACASGVVFLLELSCTVIHSFMGESLWIWSSLLPFLFAFCFLHFSSSTSQTFVFFRCRHQPL